MGNWVNVGGSSVYVRNVDDPSLEQMILNATNDPDIARAVKEIRGQEQNDD